MTLKFQRGVITFDEASRREVLSFFGKTIDSEGYLVEIENPNLKVITQEGEEIKEEEFAGIRNGSEIYIKSDLPSLIELIDKLS